MSCKGIIDAVIILLIRGVRVIHTFTSLDRELFVIREILTFRF